MSKPINISSAATFIPSSYNSSLQSGAVSVSTTGNYSANNGLNSSANTSSYAMFSGTTRNSDGFAYYDFNVTGIPENATINSVSCTARGRANSNNRGTFGFQLCNGTSGKGSEVTSTTATTTAMTLNTGTWTVNELSNVKLRIRLRRTSSNSSFAFRFYGATLEISYSVNGIEYEIVAESTYTGATVSPSYQEANEGDTKNIIINTSTISNLVVIDNDVDVTENLQYITPQTENSFTGVPSSFDSVNSSYVSAYTGTASDGLDGHNSSSRFCVFAFNEENSVSKLVYNFDCSSIPQEATIESVTCIAGAACYSNGQYFSTRTVQLYNGNTPKGTAVTITGNGNTNAAHTINGGSWTRSELDNIKLVLYIQRGTETETASYSFWGATLTIEYSLPSNPYYRYTITNINEDHYVIVKEDIILPPEEDPEKTYYPLTISSINAITEPGRGTTYVESGDTSVITIYPNDPQITLITDNGIDVSSQLVAHGGTIQQPTVETPQGASYGFVYSSSTGYYISNNKGVDKSAAVCVLNFNLPVRCLVTIDFINYAEATYDFGVFGNIDVALSNNYYAAGSGGATITDNDYKLACNTSTYNKSTVQTITYEIPSGEHFIYIKYSKDDATDNNNDTLQFKISSIEPLETNNYYTYTLSNIDEAHSLVFIFGNVSYYFINSSTNDECKLYPNGQMVQIENSGYNLVIVPANTGSTINVLDNNNNVSSILERKEVEIEKSGQTKTVVNYIYSLNNINATHNIVVSEIANPELFIKQNNSWISVSKVYIKHGNEWEIQNDYNTIFTNGKIYINN